MESTQKQPECSSHDAGDPQFPGLEIGQLAHEFVGLLGVDGTKYSLSTFKDTKVLVLMFTGNACPAAKACMDCVIAFQENYAPKGVQVVAVNPNNPYFSPRDSHAEMVKMAQEKHLSFPYLKDSFGAVARQFGARNTPHFLVLDWERRLRYRGRMFDSRDPVRATTQDLQDAVDCVLEDRPIGIPETNPLGCSIVW